jgi:hypothetical protein
MKFVAIRNMLREQVGTSAEAFDNWMRRMNAASKRTL